MENEKRLINAKPLMENGWHLVKTGKSNEFLGSLSLADVPTVDAVEVVRCKGCKHCKMCYPEKQIDKEPTPGWYCKVHKSCRKPDDFCSYGERRNDENT